MKKLIPIALPIAVHRIQIGASVGLLSAKPNQTELALDVGRSTKPSTPRPFHQHLPIMHTTHQSTKEREAGHTHSTLVSWGRSITRVLIEREF